MSSAPKEEAPAADKPKGGGPMPLVAVVLGLLNLGGMGFVAMTTMKVSKLAAALAEGGAKKEGGEKGEKGKEAVVELPSVPFDPFVVNLNEPGSNRYLKASLEVEVADLAAAEDLKRMKRAVRDDLLRYLSSLNVADTQGEEAKTKMETAMMARIDKQLGGKEKVHRLFFNDFMVQ
jgi:flagellar protein FliL